jgi:hypothetical protein
MGFRLGFTTPWEGMLARLAGKMFSVWAVKLFAGPPMGSYGANSPTMGNNWAWNQYLVSMLSGYLGGELMTRFFTEKAGRNFYQGSADLTAQKFLWSELFMKWGPTAQYLGQASRGYPSFSGGYPSFGNVEVQRLMAQGRPGDILDDGQGNRWLNQGGRWVAMMGYDMGADIVEAGPLGAEMVEAGPLGAVVEAGPLGHMMPAASTSADEAVAAYTFRGSKDPYRAAFM